MYCQPFLSKLGRMVRWSLGCTCNFLKSFFFTLMVVYNSTPPEKWLNKRKKMQLLQKSMSKSPWPEFCHQKKMSKSKRQRLKGSRGHQVRNTNGWQKKGLPSPVVERLLGGGTKSLTGTLVAVCCLLLPLPSLYRVRGALPRSRQRRRGCSASVSSSPTARTARRTWRSAPRSPSTRLPRGGSTRRSWRC